MAKRYYWLKLKEDFFDDDTISWIEEQENGKEYCLFYLKLCLKALKTDGILIRTVGDYLIPYDAKRLAEFTRTDYDTVTVAMELFKKIGLVQVLENGEIFISQLSEMVGSETEKAAAMRKSRAKKALGNNVTCMLPESYTEKEIEKEIEKEKELELEIKIDYQKIISMYNETCVSFPHLRSLSESRKKAIRARIKSGYTYDDFQTVFDKAEASSFLKGGNDRNWSATFDWLIKDANMAKVLDGNYDDRSGKHGQHGKDTGNHAEASERWGDLEITVL